MNKLLRDFRVLDLTEGVAGPCAASLLGDMGASVVKVERPEGDWGRGSEDPLGPYFTANNRNKRDLCLNIRKPGAARVIRCLVERSDVILSNYRRGVMERLGLGYEACQAMRPDIVYCTISAFGQQGPYADRPASDTGMQGLSGIMDSIGEMDGPPLRVSFPLVDIYSGSLAVQGILAALLARERGKQGSRIDVSLLNAALSLQAMPFAQFQRSGKPVQRYGNQNPVLAPAGAYPTRDGTFMTVTILGETYWERFCDAIGMSSLATVPEYRTNSLRIQNRNALNDLLSGVFRGKDRGKWVRILGDADILCYPINTFAEILDDPGLVEAMSLWQFQLAGKQMLAAGNPLQIDGQYLAVDRLPPLKGEHTIEILEELGFSRSEIDAMLEQGIAVR